MTFSPDPLASLPLVLNRCTRSISAENPCGWPGQGGRELPGPDSPARRLGQGWKVRPYVNLPAGETTTLAEIPGAGCITHIWITVEPKAYRNCILRMYWDGEEQPSVEVPLGDFFCHASTHRFIVNSAPIAVNPSGGFNSYWPLPFTKGARITLENRWHEEIAGCYYQVTWEEGEGYPPRGSGRLHAQWRRSVTTLENPEHIILDEVAGQGQYVGTSLRWNQASDGWWGEGEVKFFIDDDLLPDGEQFPTICTTGTEDYFGGAWGFALNQPREVAFSAPYSGLPLVLNEPGNVPAYQLYRWHIPDPIRFARALRVTIQALGWWPDGTFQPLQDELASVAFWYQNEPHHPFPALPPAPLLWSRTG